MAELTGKIRLDIDDGLSREERSRYRQRQAEALKEFQQVQQEQDEAIQQFANKKNYDTDEVSQSIEARNEFRETEQGSMFENRLETALDALIEEYRTYLNTQFDNPEKESKKTRIASILNVFGTPVNKQAVADAVGGSRSYMNEFQVFEEVSMSDSGGVTMHYDSETYSHEEGDEPVVLQREPRNRSRSMTKSTRSEVIQRDGNKCLRCESPDNLEVHHIVPVSQGGTDELENLATLCASCHKKTRLANPMSGGEVPAYPPGEFEAWLDDDLEICGARTNKGKLCQNPAGSCPHHN